ncbi:MULTISPECIES: hypothetical protein [unclassified Sphingobium]|uniref:hypothetical protein n=1 Tax=unclassified Sphingobium TaxID=2611147 RepID=UPI0035A632E1
MSGFDHFAVVDWSGEAVARPKGLAVAYADRGDRPPVLLAPPGGWTRERLTEWLVAHGRAGTRLLIGLDLSPALPFADEGAYFPGWPDSPADATALWAMVERHAADDLHLSVSSLLRHAEIRRHFRQHGDCGDLFPAGKGRLRVCELGQAAMGLSPSSCFNLVGAAQVGKSSLTGMRTLHRLRGVVPVWPFDPIPADGPLIVEIYTSLAAREARLPPGRAKMRDAQSLDAALAELGVGPHRALPRYSDHATDAILTTAWLRIAADRASLWNPPAMTPHIARTEGWTFGVA